MQLYSITLMHVVYYSKFSIDTLGCVIKRYNGIAQQIEMHNSKMESKTDQSLFHTVTSRLT